MAALTRCFTIGGGLHHFPAGWPLSICVTRPNRVHLRYGSRVRSAWLRPFGLLRGPPAPLPAERAISRATSFQVARSARFILAHRKAQTDPEVWKIVGGKLYLNCSKTAYEKWSRDIPGNIKKADENWLKINIGN
jgi:hypothetical protein